MSKPTLDSIHSLLLAVETKMGIEITCTRDCEVLAQEMIRFDRRFVLSVSTLRRIFGLIKSKNPPSLTTLNSLARYTGAASYSKWELTNNKDKPFINSDDIQVNSPVNENTPSTNTEVIFDTIKSLKNFLNYFEKDEDFQISYQNLKTVRDLSLFLYRMQAFPEWMWRRANRNPKARLFVETYPPYDFLSSFGRKMMIDFLETSNTTESDIFAHSLLATGSLFEGKPFSISIRNLPFLGKLDSTIHPKPQARVFGINLVALKYDFRNIENQNIDFRQAIKDGLENELEIWPVWSSAQCSFKLIISKWIILSCDMELLTILNKTLDGHRNKLLIDFRNKLDDTTLDVYQSWCLYLIGEKSQARSIIDQIESVKFRQYEERTNSMFYYALTSKLYSGKRKKSSLEELDLLTNQTKYFGLRKMLDVLN
ncbi:MAG: hypothetical protein COA49_05535 [Bacteroidetes bacterium]|nr:MAG: hypothetical protein COA49_05535 [Bacteroidota bacterium]